MNIQQKCLCAHQNTRPVAKTPQSGPHASDKVGPVQRGEAQPRRRQNGAGEVSLRETAGDSHTNHTRRGTRMPEEQGHCNKVREGLASEHLGMGWVVVCEEVIAPLQAGCPGPQLRAPPNYTAATPTGHTENLTLGKAKPCSDPRRDRPSRRAGGGRKSACAPPAPDLSLDHAAF